MLCDTDHLSYIGAGTRPPICTLLGCKYHIYRYPKPELPDAYSSSSEPYRGPFKLQNLHAVNTDILPLTSNCIVSYFVLVESPVDPVKYKSLQATQIMLPRWFYVQGFILPDGKEHGTDAIYTHTMWQGQYNNVVVKLEVAEYNYIVPTLEYVHEYSLFSKWLS